MKIVEQIVYPRVTPGVDHGAICRVLARKGLQELWYVPGHNYWSGRGSQSYSAADLHLVTLNKHPTNNDPERRRQVFPPSTKLWESGDGRKFSKKLLLAFQKQIDEFFGDSVADKLDPKKTVIL